MARQFHFKDLSLYSIIVVGLLAAQAVCSLVSAWSSFEVLEMLDRAPVTDEEAEASDAREGAIGMVGLVLFVASVVAWGFWVIRANRNVRALGATGLRFSPGWAFGYYFIPIINLYRPYQAMQDMFRAGRDIVGWQSLPKSQLVGAWWATWLVSGVVGNVAMRRSFSANTIEEFRSATQVMIAAELVALLPTALAIVMVLAVARAQRRLGLATGALSDPMGGFSAPERIS